MTLDELCDQLRGMDAEEREKAGRPLQVVALVSSACGVCALNTEGVTVDDAVRMWARMLAPARVLVAKGVLTEEQKAALRDNPPGGYIEVGQAPRDFREFPYAPASAAEVGPVTRLSTPEEDAIYAPPVVTPFPDEPGREPVGTDYRGG